MKVIDLLNKIANGEEVPKKIKYGGFIYERIKRLDSTYNYKNDGNYFEDDWLLFNILNNEVEIIEDTPKEIYFSKEENKNLMEDICKNNVEKKDNFYDYYKEDKKIEYLDYLDFKEYSDEDKMWCLLNKINKIIDKVNGEDNE